MTVARRFNYLSVEAAESKRGVVFAMHSGFFALQSFDAGPGAVGACSEFNYGYGWVEVNALVGIDMRGPNIVASGAHARE